MEFHVIVFSKDRAFQLHEYLRTLKLHLSPSSSSHYHLRISVLYHAPPGSRFGASYERVRALHPDVSFHAERSGAEFSAALCELVASSSEATSAAAATAPNVCAGNRFVLFGVDDALFFADFDLGLAAHFMRHRPSHWGFHLKLHPGICWCHPADKRATVPSLQSLRFPVAAGELQARGAPDAPVQQYSEPVLCFDVGGGGSGNDVRGTHDWVYPWELCGTVYRQADAQAMLAALAAQATAATALATSVRGTATAADPLSHPNLLEASGAKLLQGGTTADAVALRRRARVCGCPSRPVMTVVTVNRVQDIFQNRVWPIKLSPVAAPPPVAVGGGPVTCWQRWMTCCGEILRIVRVLRLLERRHLPRFGASTRLATKTCGFAACILAPFYCARTTSKMVVRKRVAAQAQAQAQAALRCRCLHL